MLRNMVMASLGNLARNRLYAAINIGGLAIALAAAILIGLFVRDDLTFDRFIPGFQQVYRLSMSLKPPQGAPLPLPEARSDFAAFLKTDSGACRASRAWFPDSRWCATGRSRRLRSCTGPIHRSSRSCRCPPTPAT